MTTHHLHAYGKILASLVFSGGAKHTYQRIQSLLVSNLVPIAPKRSTDLLLSRGPFKKLPLKQPTLIASMTNMPTAKTVPLPKKPK